MIRIPHARRIALALLSLAFSFAAAPPQDGQTAPPPLWGDLEPGPHAVGFRLLEEVDRSRSLPASASPAGTTPAPRPVRMWLWYPARADAEAEPLAFGRYVQLADADPWPHAGPAGRARVFATGPLARSLSASQRTKLLASNTAAVEDASFAPGEHPLVLFGQGLYYEAPFFHFLLCEYLASHGLVVATCPLLGAQSRLIDLDDEDLEAQVRDLEFALGVARALPHVHGERLAAAGFDMGGMAALLLTMRNPDVDALVTFDAGILHPHPAGIPASAPAYDRERLRVPWLHATQKWATELGPRAESLFETARYSDRWLLVGRRTAHVSYTSLAMVPERNEVRRYWQTTYPEEGPTHVALCRYARHFLNAFLRNDAESRDFLAGDPDDTAPGTSMTLEHRAANPAPPTVDDLVNRIHAEGAATAGATLRALHQTHPDAAVLEEETVNRLGYQFLLFWEDMEVALELFRLNVALYPDSANAHDSLGEAWYLSGDRERAAACYRRALELDPAHENAKEMLEHISDDR